MKWHSIQKQNLEINCTQSTLGFQISQNIKALLKDKLSALTEKVLNEWNHHTGIVKIDEINLDLGNIPAINWENHLLEKYEYALRKELQEKIIETISLNEISGSEPLPTAHAALDLLEFYLKNGFLPWWFQTAWGNLLSTYKSQKKRSKNKYEDSFSLKNLLLYLSMTQPEACATWLKKNIDHSSIRQRIHTQLPLADFHTLITQRIVHKKWLIQIHRDLSGLLRQVFRNKVIQQKLLFLCLVEVFQKGKNSKERLRTGFVQEILKKILSKKETEYFWTKLPIHLHRASPKTKFVSKLEVILNELSQKQEKEIIRQKWLNARHWTEMIPWLGPSKGSTLWQILFPHQAKQWIQIIQNFTKLSWQTGFPRIAVASMPDTPRVQIQASLLALLWEDKSLQNNPEKTLHRLLLKLTEDMPFLEKEFFLRKSLLVLPQYSDVFNQERLFPKQTALLETLCQQIIELPWPVGFPTQIATHLPADLGTQVQAYLLTLLWEKKTESPSQKNIFLDLMREMSSNMPQDKKTPFLKKVEMLLPQYQPEIRTLQQTKTNLRRSAAEWKAYLRQQPESKALEELKKITPTHTQFLQTYILELYQFLEKENISPKTAYTYLELFSEVLAILQRQPHLSIRAFLVQHLRQVRAQLSLLGVSTDLLSDDFILKIKKNIPILKPYELSDVISPQEKDKKKTEKEEQTAQEKDKAKTEKEEQTTQEKDKKKTEKEEQTTQEKDKKKTEKEEQTTQEKDKKKTEKEEQTAQEKDKKKTEKEEQTAQEKDKKKTEKELKLLSDILSQPQSSPFILLKLLLEGQTMPTELQLRQISEVSFSIEQVFSEWIEQEPKRFEEIIQNLFAQKKAEALSQIFTPYFSEKFRANIIQKIKRLFPALEIPPTTTQKEILGKEIQALLKNWEKKAKPHYASFKQKLRKLLPTKTAQLIQLLSYFFNTKNITSKTALDDALGEELLLYFSQEFTQEFHWWVEAIQDQDRQKANKLQPEIIQNASKEILKRRQQARLEKIKKAFSPRSLEPLSIHPLNEIYIQNAGLVLLHPFLGRLFGRLGYLENREFKSNETAERGTHLLQYILNKNEKSEEYELPFNKILCGLPINMPLAKEVGLSDEEKEMADSLLVGVIQNWSVLKNTSPDSLRASFLMREGKLSEYEQHWQLEVAPKGIDVLLGQLPWGLSTFKLNWMKKLFQVEWNVP